MVHNVFNNVIKVSNDIACVVIILCSTTTDVLMHTCAYALDIHFTMRFRKF